ncbi:Glycosyltransferase involved in cell wall bisynthesis [Peptoclostridium litorale DSM 5388]|uniref:Glycosyl transferase, group 1 n=1 Tax=Peptoclostridium litorale DSM 5388 TaxID=1121324 RepID=A0A069RC16_PEPLI|nr:GT4 family glycosyltransferase PelF [Peptoclostridium litorale]KDR93800.1 glycosyl transferase, group 1 [Peptoclostridium litorale DSM 5388]SIN86095.1 Glycosyltransferase involved in cell wall bisynthesis [Peptoclostridium litorale DSM 5388]
MEICILAEGSYPYVSGGVSSWIHTLVRGMPDKKFKIFSIMPSLLELDEYKYEIPGNVVEIKTVGLRDYEELSPQYSGFSPNIGNDEKKQIEKFLKMESDIDWNAINNILSDKGRLGNPVQFLQSRMFWDVYREFYSQHMFRRGFNKSFWTVRSMLLPAINLMQQELPSADIYHAVSTGYAGLMASIAKSKTSKPFVLTEHGIYAREREEEILKASWIDEDYRKMWIDFFYFISTCAYENADSIVSLFERSRFVQIQLGAQIEKTMVVPNGIDIQNLNIDHKKVHENNIGAILRVVPIKDVKTLVRAFKIVKSSIYDAKLYLIGPYDEDREYHDEVVQLIKNLELEADVYITGSVDIKEYMEKLDVLVLTSISEGQPLVMLEGMACKRPFVSTDVGACREIVEGAGDDKLGKCGIITPPVSPMETASGIIDILKDREAAMAMGETGRKRVEKHYTREQLIERYVQLYEGLGD